jgi:hypothetical protein
MTPAQTRKRILERLNQLSEREQRQILEFAERLSTPRGASGKDLLEFFGTIDSEDCRRMEEAIEAGCERVDPRDW